MCWGTWKATPLFRRRSIICASNFQITEFLHNPSQSFQLHIRQIDVLNIQALVYLVNWLLRRSIITKYFIQILEKIPALCFKWFIYTLTHSHSPKFIVLSHKQYNDCHSQRILIHLQWSRRYVGAWWGLCRGLWLVFSDHVTYILDSDWRLTSYLVDDNLRLNALFIKFAVDNPAITSRDI